MGIRINKALGYGLTDVKYDCENWKLLDERFDPEGVMFAKYLGCDEPFRAEDWWKWLLEKRDSLPKVKFTEDRDLYSLRHDIVMMLNWKKAHEDKAKRWNPWSSVVFQPEFGGSKILLLVPPRHADGIFGDWSRYDDMIDYMEETVNHGCEPRVECYRWRTLYPHCGCVNRNTGKASREWTGGGLDFFRAVNAMLDKGEVKLMSRELNMIAEQLGFTDATDAYENLRPEVPMDLQLFCEWSKMFRDPKTVFDLLPMLYVYWC